MKAFTDAQYAMKAAVRRAVKLAGGPSAASDVMRVDAARLSRYGNADAPEFAPVDVAYELDRAAGDNVVLRAWADMCGFDLMARNLDQRIATDLTAAACDIARESGELIATAVEAGADKVITPNEAKQIVDEATELQENVVRLRESALRAMKTG